VAGEDGLVQGHEHREHHRDELAVRPLLLPHQPPLGRRQLVPPLAAHLNGSKQAIGPGFQSVITLVIMVCRPSLNVSLILAAADARLLSTVCRILSCRQHAWFLTGSSTSPRSRHRWLTQPTAVRYRGVPHELVPTPLDHTIVLACRAHIVRSRVLHTYETPAVIL
jgi:hypothetical protein